MTFALYAYSRLSAGNVENADKAMYIMPTGNMSNVVASVMAKMSGCPMGKVVAAVGANNQVAPMIYPGESIFRQQDGKLTLHAGSGGEGLVIISVGLHFQGIFQGEGQQLPGVGVLVIQTAVRHFFPEVYLLFHLF